MKIEKISDNQIRCILDREDLSVRGIEFPNFSYASERGVKLFKEIMLVAFMQADFNYKNHPVEIEAIPLTSGELEVIITKKEELEELDARFSNFAPEEDDLEKDSSISEESEFEFVEEDSEEDEEQNFIPLSDMLKRDNKEVKPVDNTIRVYRFSSLATLSEAAFRISGLYKGFSAVYKERIKKEYYLILIPDKLKEEEEVMNILSEYGSPFKSNYASHSYIKEHFEPIITENAFDILSSL